MPGSISIIKVVKPVGVTFTVPVRVDRAAPVGSDTVVVSARYQACNATLCLPPQTAKVPVVVQVTK